MTSRRIMAGSWMMILVLTIVMVVLYVDNKRTRQCLSDYMVKDNESSQIRIGANSEERDYFKTNVLRVIINEPNPAKRREAIESYIDLLDRNDQVRKENPVPPVPTECD